MMLWPLSCAVLLTNLLVLTGTGGLVRAALVVALFVFVPGWAWTRRLGVRSIGDAIALAIGVSVSIGTLVSLLLIYLNVVAYDKWSVAVLSAITLAAFVELPDHSAAAR